MHSPRLSRRKDAASHDVLRNGAGVRARQGTTLVSSHRQRSSNRVILGTVRVLSAAASPPVSEYAENDVKYLTSCRRPRSALDRTRMQTTGTLVR